MKRRLVSNAKYGRKKNKIEDERSGGKPSSINKWLKTDQNHENKESNDDHVIKLSQTNSDIILHWVK